MNEKLTLTEVINRDVITNKIHNNNQNNETNNANNYNELLQSFDNYLIQQNEFDAELFKLSLNPRLLELYEKVEREIRIRTHTNQQLNELILRQQLITIDEGEDEIIVKPIVLTQLKQNCLTTQLGILAIGTTIVIASRPGMGKTAVLINLISEIETTGLKQLVICESSNDIQERLNKFMEKDYFPNIKMKFNDYETIELQHLIATSDAKVIYLDDWNYEWDFEKIKSTAKRYNKILIVTSDLTKEIEESEFRIPKTKYLKFQSLMKCDKIFLLYKPSYYCIIEDENISFCNKFFIYKGNDLFLKLKFNMVTHKIEIL